MSAFDTLVGQDHVVDVLTDAAADANGFRYGQGVAPGTKLYSFSTVDCGAPWPPAGGWQELSKRGLAAGTQHHDQVIEQVGGFFQQRLVVLRNGRQRHLERGKLLPRDRVEALLDDGTAFLEIAPLAAEGLYGGDAPAPSYGGAKPAAAAKKQQSMPPPPPPPAGAALGGLPKRKKTPLERARDAKARALYHAEVGSNPVRRLKDKKLKTKCVDSLWLLTTGVGHAAAPRSLFLSSSSTRSLTHTNTTLSACPPRMPG